MTPELNQGIGDLAAVIEEAVTEKLERLEARRFAKVKRPRVTTRRTEAARHIRTTATKTDDLCCRRKIRPVR